MGRQVGRASQTRPGRLPEIVAAPRKKRRPSAVLDELKGLYRFMEDQGLELLELDQGPGCRVRLLRRSAYTAAPPQTEPPTPSPASGGPGGSAPSRLKPGEVFIKSPMQGIFYRAASPSSPPFVKEQDEIREGAVLCMIEAMKVFNEVKAEFGLKVVKILVENGKPVKAGQDILLVEKPGA